MSNRQSLLRVASCSAVLVAGLAFVSEGTAQPPFRDPRENQIKWEHGPCTAKVGTMGEVKVPAGYKFTGVEGTRLCMEITQNTPSPADQGLICPSDWGAGVGGTWFMTFEWEGMGYVKDDDKNNLDANAILASIRKSQEMDNNRRTAEKRPTLEIVGWEHAPFYDPESNNLIWATRLRSQGGIFDTINYNSRILGRHGVMSANLVIAPEILQQELPKYKEILQGYSFAGGQKYSEFRPGDKVAAVGLTALAAGGLAAVAAKSGFLAKFGKLLVVGVVAVFAGIGAIFKKIFGRGETA